MNELKYPTRCLKDIFGYCKANVKGLRVSTPDKSISYTGSEGECAENQLECKNYITNVVANPYRPELVGTVLKMEIIPPSGGSKTKKHTKQKPLKI